MNKFFVKFVPYNEYTIQNLINKTIRFSTVLDFNDFNEESIFVGNTIESEKIKCDIQDYLKIPDNYYKFIDGLKRCASFKREYKNESLENFDLEKDCNNLGNAIAIIAYLNTGIFCVSDIKVFKNDSAQLMFAHYGNNLKGLALIYEYTEKKAHKITYKGNILGYEKNSEEGLLELIKGKETESFLNKSKKWRYENEYRLFSKPGIEKASEHNLELKGIFYTARLEDNIISTLKSINGTRYEDKLFITEVYKNSSKRKKFLEATSGKCPYEYLTNKNQ